MKMFVFFQAPSFLQQSMIEENKDGPVGEVRGISGAVLELLVSTSDVVPDPEVLYFFGSFIHFLSAGILLIVLISLLYLFLFIQFFQYQCSSSISIPKRDLPLC